MASARPNCTTALQPTDRRSCRLSRAGWRSPLFSIPVRISWCAVFLLCAVAAGTAATVHLAWDPPAKNADGSPLTGLQGYKLHYGIESGSYDCQIDVGSDTGASISGLAPTVTYYFSVTAYNCEGKESDFAGEFAWKWCDENGGKDEYIWLEAENGDLAAPISVLEDLEASGGRYVRTDTIENGGTELTFHVRGGDYVIWARAAAGPLYYFQSYNSFHVSVDGETEDVWDINVDLPESEATNWCWDAVSGRGEGSWTNVQLDPRVFSLAEGQHTLRLRSREAHSKLDLILITSDLGCVPEQMLAREDGDGDGQSDTWEQAYFDACTGAGTLPDDDPDGDGASNLQEYVSGTDPMSAASHATVAIDAVNGSPRVSFDALAAQGFGYAGTRRYYTLQTRRSLTAGDWRVVPGFESILATNQAVVHRVGPGEKVGYYRTRIELR